MILQKEIIEKAQVWKVLPDTVDKDYVLGHFLSVFVAHYKDSLAFKGGTCLRKCYIENYRFSEDLDFTATEKNFVLNRNTLQSIMKKAKIKNEDVTLNFRVPKELKTKIIRESEQMNLTVSKYLRDVLERVHEGTFCGDGEQIQPRREYLLSRRFLKLAVWIYSKKETDRRADSDTDEALDEYIKTIKKGDQYLSKKVNYELNKVLADLLRIKAASGYEKEIFFFTRDFREEKKVNFEVLNNYYLTDSLEVFFNEIWM